MQDRKRRDQVVRASVSQRRAEKASNGAWSVRRDDRRTGARRSPDQARRDSKRHGPGGRQAASARWIDHRTGMRLVSDGRRRRTAARAEANDEQGIEAGQGSKANWRQEWGSAWGESGGWEPHH